MTTYDKNNDAHRNAEIQAALFDLGFYTGRLDGWFSTLTKRAIKFYQTYIGEEPTGKITDEQVQELLPPKERVEHVITPPPAFTKNVWARSNERDLVKMYGERDTNQTMLYVPYPMVLAWQTKTKIERFSIHEKCHDSALRALKRVRDAYSPEDIVKHGFNKFAGCLNVRKAKGGDFWSRHSWGIAIDIDSARNRYSASKSEAYLSRTKACDEFIRIWRDEENWRWGMDMWGKDAMHFEATKS